MNLKDVMEEIAEKLRTFLGVTAYSYPTDTVVPPAAILSFPDRIAYDVTYRQGEAFFWNLPLYMVTNRVDGKTARNVLSEWADVNGNKSIQQYLSNTRYSTCGSVQVVNATFDVVTIAGIDYMAVVFELNVSGEGL